jgi:hypothetical protein
LPIFSFPMYTGVPGGRPLFFELFLRKRRDNDSPIARFL